MRVLILSSIYHPDVAANSKRMAHLAQGLRLHGHQVTVVTSFPHYPHGRIPPQYRGRWLVGEEVDGIQVHRCFTYASPRRTITRRLLNFSVFAASSTLAARRLPGRYDAIVTISPPLFSGISAYLVCRSKQAPFIFDVQDLYPETAVHLNALRSPWLIRTAEALERFIYRKAGLITVISQGFKENLLRKGVPGEKVRVVPNWVDVEAFAAGDGSPLRRKFGLEGKFVVMNLGTIGLAQGAEHVVEAGRRLAHVEDISFVFVGDGVDKNRIAALAHGCRNITFIPAQPHSEVPNFLAMADVGVVHLRDNPLYTITIPSRTYEYMGAGKPIIMAVRGEAQDLVAEAQCGLHCAPEDPAGIAEAVLVLHRERKLGQDMGARGRQYSAENLGRQQVVSRFVTAIEDCSRKHKGEN